MGFARQAEEGSRHRFSAPSGRLGTRIDVLVAQQPQRGRMGAGTIHHIAFRNTDDASQLEWQAKLGAESLEVTPVMDRTYFHSVYFREPGGVLFELATDPPGFALDEPLETLGESLKLPDWLEPKRSAIEKHLPPLVAGAAKEVAR
jgi:glyoxalase family protein